MREPIYQAYLKDENRMVQVTNLNLIKNTKGEFEYQSIGFYVDGKGTFEGTGFDLNNVELRQYTGLKDKNGKEIYEGDIIRTWEQEEYVPDRDSGGGIVGYDKVDGFSQLGVVSYQEASFIYTTQKHLEGREEHLNAPIDWFDDLVVVGNVYENPELLQS